MKYESVKQYYQEMPEEALAHMAKNQARELLDTVLGNIERDVWYIIRMSENDIQILGEIRKTITVDIEPAIGTTCVYIPPEKIYLAEHNIPLKKKLKNCIDYLKDKSGAKMKEA